MAEVHSPGDIEKAKHEQFERDVPRGLKPGNPYVKRDFPAMMYRAQRLPGNGKWACSAPQPRYFGFHTSDEWTRACQEAEVFTASCQTIVNSPEERRRRMNEGLGWSDSQADALAWAASLDKIVGDEAAARNYRDRNMSEKALAERDAAEAAHFGHLPSIPEAPRSGRRGKRVTIASTPEPDHPAAG